MKSKLLLFIFLISHFVFSQTSSDIQKLEDFAKIYSVVRHFHPSDEAANLQWDLFATYGVEEVLKTKNQKEFEAKIKELFVPIAPSITYGKEEYQWGETNAKPVYWVHFGLGSGSKSEEYKRQRKNIDSITLKIKNNKIPEKFYTLNLSGNFKVTVPLIVYQKNGKTLPLGNTEAYKNLKPQAFGRNEAVGNMIIMWSGLRHFFPYQDEMKLDWDKILNEGLTSTFNNKSEEENLFALRKISHYFNDGHMWVTSPQYSQKNYFSPGIKTKYLRDTKQLVISDILNEIPELKNGDVITKIDQQDTQSVIDNTKQYWSGSDQYNTKNALTEIFRGKENSPVTLTLENGKTLQLKRDFSTRKSADFFNQDNPWEMQELSDKILYINLQNLKKETVNEKASYIKSFDKIILDDRRYPKKGYGGAFELLLTFFSDRNSVKFMAYPQNENPFFNKSDFSNYFGWKIKRKEDLNAKIALLICEGSGSFQESITQYLKGNNYVTLIGRTTGGVNGNINRVNLLNGMGYSFTGLKVRNPDGSLFHAIGVQPDITVEDNIEDIRNGKDTFIEKAIVFLNAK